MSTLNAQMYIRRDTAADWTSTNPTLAAGEIGYETDTLKYKIGDGTTAWTSLEYWLEDAAHARGLVSEIKTNNTPASDLIVTTGSEKTLELATSVYEDIQFPTATAKLPASNFPTWTQLTTNLYDYAFDVGDYLHLQSNELMHAWKEGTVGSFHCHTAIPDANASGGSYYVNIEIIVGYVNASSIW